MKSLFLTLVVSALATAALAAPAPVKKTNLLVNGSFEEGPPVGNWLSLNPGSTDIKGWEVTRGQIDLVGNYWPAAQGNRSLDLHGSPGLGGVKQSFETRPGRTYVVSFSLAANPDGAEKKKTIGVSAAGMTGEFTADATNRTNKDVGWQKTTWKFTAAEKKTTIEFYTLMKSDESCGPLLDDVSVLEMD